MKDAQLPAGGAPILTEKDLHALARKTFRYFWSEANPDNGLIADHTLRDVPASIAGVGMALAAYPVGVERRFVSVKWPPAAPSQPCGSSTRADRGAKRTPLAMEASTITFLM